MTRILALAAALAVTGAAAFAQSSAPTLGEQLANGQLSQPAFVNLISGSGVSADEARAMTLSDIVRAKWADE